MKLSDYVVEFLAEQGVNHVFGVTGGAVVHLFDSVARNPQMKPVFTHHEQAAALAAEAYARVRNGIGSAFVTTGPGGTNAITGVCAAWLDSIPCIYVSGQTRKEHTSRGKGIRQLGSQELDILSLTAPITKYAAMVEEPKTIKYHLQKAAYLATSGRPGPVWIDIPLDSQWAAIEPGELPGFEAPATSVNDSHIEEQVQKVIQLIKDARRPLVLAGYGIRLSHAEKEFRNLIQALQVPFVTTWNARDLLPSDLDLHLGCPGFEGERGANLAIQNCDLLLCIGSHLSIPLTGTMFKAFAREAKIVMVDIDAVELNHRNVRVDLPVQCDARLFISGLLKQSQEVPLTGISDWQEKCRQYKSRYNPVPAEWWQQKEHVNPYIFIEALSEKLSNDDVTIVDGGGTVTQVAFQTFKVKEGQRLSISAGICAMGTGLPESIGACFGNGGRRTICLCGDGSLQFNIQELQTVVHHNLPIKLFVFNNGGYLAIRNTQDGFLDSRYVGSEASGGLSLPDFQKVARAYGIRSMRINNHRELRRKITLALETPGAVLCEVMIDRKAEIMPRQGFDKRPDGTGVARPLEDMYPYLPRKELLENMLIKPWPGAK